MKIYIMNEMKPDESIRSSQVSPAYIVPHLQTPFWQTPPFLQTGSQLVCWYWLYFWMITSAHYTMTPSLCSHSNCITAPFSATMFFGRSYYTDSYPAVRPHAKLNLFGLSTPVGLRGIKFSPSSEILMVQFAFLLLLLTRHSKKFLLAWTVRKWAFCDPSLGLQSILLTLFLLYGILLNCRAFGSRSSIIGPVETNFAKALIF